MRIGFDARMIDHPGIGRYITNLLNAMLAINNEHEFILYGDPAKIQIFQRAKIKEYYAPVYSFRELSGSVLKKDGLDILHVPHFSAPLFGIKNLVLTIHDLIYLKFPETRSFLKGLVARPLIANAVRQAKKIIAVSQNTSEDIRMYFPGVNDKIRVVPEAPDPAFKPLGEDVNKERIRGKYNLPQEFLLFVGSLRSHKNIPGLIKAYANLKKDGCNCSLVIVGRSYRNSGAILQEIRDNGVIFLGEIPSEELVYIYNLANFVVIPSFYEGFGLPVLEAMACGTPVAASRVSSLPEVAKEAAAFFNPYDTQEMASVLSGLIRNKERRQELSRAGIERAGCFSWKNTALQTLEIYREAYGNDLK
jgi:glycosyltransferase involved in cell wall biosynthesis